MTDEFAFRALRIGRDVYKSYTQWAILTPSHNALPEQWMGSETRVRNILKHWKVQYPDAKLVKRYVTDYIEVEE